MKNQEILLKVAEKIVLLSNLLTRMEDQYTIMVDTEVTPTAALSASETALQDCNITKRMANKIYHPHMLKDLGKRNLSDELKAAVKKLDALYTKINNTLTQIISTKSMLKLALVDAQEEAAATAATTTQYEAAPSFTYNSDDELENDSLEKMPNEAAVSMGSSPISLEETDDETAALYQAAPPVTLPLDEEDIENEKPVSISASPVSVVHTQESPSSNVQQDSPQQFYELSNTDSEEELENNALDRLLDQKNLAQNRADTGLEQSNMVVPSPVVIEEEDHEEAESITDATVSKLPPSPEPKLMSQSLRHDNESPGRDATQTETVLKPSPIKPAALPTTSLPIRPMPQKPQPFPVNTHPTGRFHHQRALPFGGETDGTENFDFMLFDELRTARQEEETRAASQFNEKTPHTVDADDAETKANRRYAAAMLALEGKNANAKPHIKAPVSDLINYARESVDNKGVKDVKTLDEFSLALELTLERMENPRSHKAYEDAANNRIQGHGSEHLKKLGYLMLAIGLAIGLVLAVASAPLLVASVPVITGSVLAGISFFNSRQEKGSLSQKATNIVDAYRKGPALEAAEAEEEYLNMVNHQC